MNARYLRKTAKDLNNYQKRVILSLALREKDDLPTRVKYLKKLAYCTDEAKFEVLKESDTVSEGLYDSLYELYFGTVWEDEPEPEPAPEPVQDFEQDERDFERYGEQDGEQDTIQEDPSGKVKRHERKSPHNKKWTDDDCMRLIEEYNRGRTSKELGAMFGISPATVDTKLYQLRKGSRFSGLLARKCSRKRTRTAEPADAPEITQKKVGLPKAFTATGTGLLTVEDGLKLDGEPLLTMLRQEIVKKGMEQFYAAVEIVIRPVEPKGMVVTTEEEE